MAFLSHNSAIEKWVRPLHSTINLLHDCRTLDLNGLCVVCVCGRKRIIMVTIQHQHSSNWIYQRLNNNMRAARINPNAGELRKWQSAYHLNQEQKKKNEKRKANIWSRSLFPMSSIFIMISFAFAPASPDEWYWIFAIYLRILFLKSSKTHTPNTKIIIHDRFGYKFASLCLQRGWNTFWSFAVGWPCCGSDKLISEMVFDFTNGKIQWYSKKMRLPRLCRQQAKGKKIASTTTTTKNKTIAIYIQNKCKQVSACLSTWL